MNRFYEPITEVRHADLERSGDSSYRSLSPCCRSALLVRRDQNLKLCREDLCVLCGKRYRYTDDSINGERFAEEPS